MTSTQTAPSDSSTPARAASRVLLWLPVPAVAAMAHLLIQGDLALSGGVADLDPLHGLSEIAIGAVATLIGVGPLVYALLYSFAPAPARSGVSLGTAVWTAVVGVGFVAFMAWVSATDHQLVSSSTAGVQHGWQAAAAFVVVLPLLVVVAVRAYDRAHDRAHDRALDH